MGIETVIGAAVGIGGLVSSRSNARRANRAMDAQADAAQQQVQLGQEQLAFSREQFEQWMQDWGPLLDTLRTEAMEEQRPDFDAIAADTASAYDTGREITQRNRERSGLRPSGGARVRDERRYALGRAAGTVNARNQAREEVKDRRYNRLSALGGIATGQRAQAQAGVESAYGGARSALGSAGSAYGQQAGVYGGLAAEGARAFTGTNWAELWNATRGQEPPPPSSSGGSSAPGY